jgi:hypothetical protein
MVSQSLSQQTSVSGSQMAFDARQARAVLVGVGLGAFVAGTAVFVGVFVGVLVAGTAVLVGVLVGVFVAGTAVLVGVLVGVRVGVAVGVVVRQVPLAQTWPVPQQLVPQGVVPATQAQRWRPVASFGRQVPEQQFPFEVQMTPPARQVAAAPWSRDQRMPPTGPPRPSVRASSRPTPRPRSRRDRAPATTFARSSNLRSSTLGSSNGNDTVTNLGPDTSPQLPIVGQRGSGRERGSGATAHDAAPAHDSVLRPIGTGAETPSLIVTTCYTKHSA